MSDDPHIVREGAIAAGVCVATGSLAAATSGALIGVEPAKAIVVCVAALVGGLVGLIAVAAYWSWRDPGE